MAGSETTEKRELMGTLRGQSLRSPVSFPMGRINVFDCNSEEGE